MFSGKMRVVSWLVLGAVLSVSGVYLYNCCSLAACRAVPKQVAEKPAKGPSNSNDKGKKEEIQKLVGVWERRMDFQEEDKDLRTYYVLTVCVLPDRLSVSAVEGGEQGRKQEEICSVLEADFSITKDDVLYGVVTSADASTSGKFCDPQELNEAKRDSLKFINQPFAVRYRVDENVLTITDYKFMGIDVHDRKKWEEHATTILGRYEKKSGAPAQQANSKKKV